MLLVFFSSNFTTETFHVSKHNNRHGFKREGELRTYIYGPCGLFFVLVSGRSFVYVLGFLVRHSPSDSPPLILLVIITVSIISGKIY